LQNWRIAVICNLQSAIKKAPVLFRRGPFAARFGRYRPGTLPRPIASMVIIEVVVVVVVVKWYLFMVDYAGLLD
jgi:hypothetical protein